LKVGIAGAGAVGCHYGSFLQRAGVEVFYLARGAHLAALQEQGLTHISEGTSTKLDVRAGDDAALLSGCDVVILACKTTALDELCRQIAPVITKESVLVTMQNGVTAPDQVAGHFPGSPVIAASAFIGVRIDEPGVIVHSAAGHLRLGLWKNHSGKAETVLATLIESWQQAGVDAQAVADMRAMLWHKMVWNCGFNAITALTRRFARDVAAEEDSARWVRSAMRESVAVAKVLGVELATDVMEQHMQLTMKAGPVKSSMWQDLEHGRLTEIEAMNGYIAGRAKESGLSAPVNDVLASLIRAAEASRN